VGGGGAGGGGGGGGWGWRYRQDHRCLSSNPFTYTLNAQVYVNNAASKLR